MKAYVITLDGNEYSEHAADRCITSAAQHNLVVEKWYGVDKTRAEQEMSDAGLEWTWAKDNTEKDICPISGLQQFPYYSNGQLADLKSKIGCSMSHFYLWQKCAEMNEPILILEHDAVFINDMPVNPYFTAICQINDPVGATPKGQWWHDQMVKRNRGGVSNKTRIVQHDPNIPDGLAGNSAYMIKPEAAQQLIEKTHSLGLWTNDALICIQNFPYLEEYYPFITIVKQTQSTSSA